MFTQKITEIKELLNKKSAASTSSNDSFESDKVSVDECPCSWSEEDIVNRTDEEDFLMLRNYTLGRICCDNCYRDESSLLDDDITLASMNLVDEFKTKVTNMSLNEMNMHMATIRELLELAECDFLLDI